MMKDRAQFWINLLVSTILPLVLTGGSASLLVLFRENLPHLLYVTILWILWLVIIAILLRLAFGDLIDRLRIWIRQNLRHRARQKLAEEWYEKWRELGLILFDVAKKKWKPIKKQKEDFSRLRTWFRINRSKFLHIWHSFEYSRRKMAHDYYGSSTSLEHEVFYDNHDDPFSYFYEPLTIEQLEHLLQYHHDEMPEVMLKLKELMDECVQWVSQE